MKFINEVEKVLILKGFITTLVTLSLHVKSHRIKFAVEDSKLKGNEWFEKNISFNYGFCFILVARHLIGLRELTINLFNITPK